MREHLALTRHQAARWTARVRDSGGAETLLASPRLVHTGRSLAGSSRLHDLNSPWRNKVESKRRAALRWHRARLHDQPQTKERLR
jgi:hypothetical protein